METRHADSEFTLITVAHRDSLAIAEECIELTRVSDLREPGTLIIAELDSSNTINESTASDYLKPYVRFLPVPVYLNGQLISQESYHDFVASLGTGFDQIYQKIVTDRAYKSRVVVSVNSQGRLFARLTDITLTGTPLSGEACFVQDGGSTYAYRNFFGLAPVPVSGHYRLGGYINLDILRPTAGREALSRDSIQHVANFVKFVESACSLAIADNPAADINQPFQRHIWAQGQIELAKNVRILARPSGEMVPLGGVNEYQQGKSKHYYTGRDATILTRFASEQSNLFHVSQDNPRRDLQTRYLRQYVKLKRVPEEVIVDRIPQNRSDD